MGWKADYKVADIYKDCEDMPISQTDYSKFISECNGALMYIMIDENVPLTMPTMGHLSVKKVKPKIMNEDGTLRKKGLKPDWKRTWELWHSTWPDKTREEIVAMDDKPLVYHTNMHSRGYEVHFVWDMITTPMKAKNMYEFKAAREFSRHLSKQFREGNVDFYEMKAR